LRKAGYEPKTDFGWQRKGETTIYDLYSGNRVYTTELLTSPLVKGGNIKIREWKKIYLGILDLTDLIISKMFRGTQADIDDCLALLQNQKVIRSQLEKRYKETAKYDVSENKVMGDLKILFLRAKEHRLL
jgi:hypothetical protein